MTFLERLAAGEPILCDGGTGTERRRTGATAGEIHRAFVEAGAELVIADSLTTVDLAVRDRDAGLAAMASAVEEARASGAELVAASVGPTSPGTDDAIRRERYDALAKVAAVSMANVLFAETLLSLADADAAVAAARRAGIPVAVTFSVGRDGRGFGGLAIEAMWQWSHDARVDAAGLNCGDSLESVVLAGGEWRWRSGAAGSSLPFVFRPAAGDAPSVLFASVLSSVAPETRIVGGCCGATPAHIRALAAALGRNPRGDG